MAKFSLGDEVLVYHPSYRNGDPGETSKAIVVKEGRKYVFVEGPWGVNGIGFDKETGRTKQDPRRNTHYDPSIHVPAEWEAQEHRSDVLNSLRELGVRFDRSYLRDKRVEDELSTEKLEKLLAVMQEDI